MGDRGVDLGQGRCGEGTDGEPGDGGRRFVASEPVEKGGEDRQGGADHGGVARVVEVADRQRDVIERGQRVAVFGLEAGQSDRQDVSRCSGCRCLGRSPGPGAGRPARRRDRRRGRRSRGNESANESTYGLRVASAASIRPFAAAIASSPATGDRQCDDQVCPGDCVGVAAACELGAAPLDPPFGLADEQVRSAERGPRRRTAPRRCGHCRSPAGRRRCSRQPPRSVRPFQHCDAITYRNASRGWSTARAGSMSSSAQAIGS